MMGMKAVHVASHGRMADRGLACGEVMATPSGVLCYYTLGEVVGSFEQGRVNGRIKMGLRRSSPVAEAGRF